MEYQAVLDYIDAYWPRIIRHNPRSVLTLIGLPRPFLVPSDGHMFQEMYYWDSFFMSLGVLGTKHEHLVVDMAENCAFLLRHYGLIPNASRHYFLSRSQPPFFTQLIWLAYEVQQRLEPEHAENFLRRMMRVAQHEHETVWKGEAQPHRRRVYRGLSRYFDINFLDILASCESGWDHSTRCDDRWLEHLPVDLNSILYVREQDFARAADHLGKPREAEVWRKRAEERAATMQDLMWDRARRLFLDYDWSQGKRNPHASLAGFYPLWAGIATEEQAEQIVRTWLPSFEFSGGLVTTLQAQEGRQWAYPNGWAPLQWIVTGGLERYGYEEDANRIRRKWCDLCARKFEETGTMWEKYNVVEDVQAEAGLYGAVTGFGWTNAVFVDFVKRLEASKE